MPDPSEVYTYVRAIRFDDRVRWEYQVSGSPVPGRMTHDEPVGDYTDEQIRNLTVDMLDVPQDFPIELLYE